MNYPFWDPGLGYGMLMGVVAVVHVFISHFAIGGGLYLVVSEMWARKRQDQVMLEFLRRLTRFFVLVTLVAGALTGVGIWFIIGLLNPAATEVLIHNFLWAWAAEWAFFVIEICAAIVYLYGWKRLRVRDHIIVGWIYFGAAWMSLVIINGIITFMLTPGGWISTGAFWDGFFNPTFWPSVVTRTGICVMLAGLYGVLVASRLSPIEDRGRITRYNAVWGLAGLAITLPSFFWYTKAIPAEIIQRAETMFWPAASIAQSYKYAAAIAVLLLVFGLIAPRRNHLVAAVLVMLAGFAWFGAFEWFRESVRKPYVIDGYMYANAVEVARVEDYRRDGLLAHMKFTTGDPGADLFRRACGSCHMLGGYRDIKPAFDGTDPEFIAGLVRGAHKLVGNMPPFYGTDEEADLLARHIHGRVDQRHLSEIHGLQGVDLGKKVYEVRCGRCHVMGGHNDKWEGLQGMSREDYEDILAMAGEFAEEMPAFTGDTVEREALVEYFLSLD